MTRIGYAKLGRSMAFAEERQGFQGNAACGNLLVRLAERNPDVEFVLVGKSDNSTEGFPENITNPWAGKARSGWNQRKGGPLEYTPGRGEEYDVVADMRGLDGMILHLGQHGTTHDAIPQVPFLWASAKLDDEQMTHPFVWARNYGDYLVKGMNANGDRTDGQAPVVYICEDSRNYHKARDVKWPTGADGILAQYQYTKTQLHERFLDSRKPGELGFRATLKRNGELWEATHTYEYGGIEMMILPDDWETWGTKPYDERRAVGVATTSHARGREQDRRSVIVRDFMLKNYPAAEVWGKWDDKSLLDVPDGTVQLGDPMDFADHLQSWKSSLVLPIAGTNWCTAKSWQVMAARTVALHIGRVDKQGWVIPSRHNEPGTKLVGRVASTPLYSVRPDWTQEELFLARCTRIEKPDEFKKAVDAVAASEELYDRLTTTARTLLKRRWDEHLTESLIEKRLGL